MSAMVANRRRRTALHAAAAFLFLIGTACGTEGTTTASKPATTQERVGGILNQPLDDLNISGDEIPPLLIATANAPYAPPVRTDCAGLVAEVTALNGLLGPDLAPVTPAGNEPIINEDSATDAAWDAARSAAVGWVPFRGVVRFVTGADRREARVKHAILAGFVRRAYLKGLAQTQHCPSPPPPSHAASSAG